MHKRDEPLKIFYCRVNLFNRWFNWCSNTSIKCFRGEDIFYPTYKCQWLVRKRILHSYIVPGHRYAPGKRMKNPVWSSLLRNSLWQCNILSNNKDYYTMLESVPRRFALHAWSNMFYLKNIKFLWNKKIKLLNVVKWMLQLFYFYILSNLVS